MESRTRWDTLWKECSGTVSQNWDYNEAQKNSGKSQVVLTVEHEEKLKAGLFAYERTLSTPLGKKNILEVHGDPLFVDTESEVQLLKKFKDHAQRYFYGTVSLSLHSTLHESFIEEKYKKDSNYTSVINLTLSEEELWNALEKKSARWGAKTGSQNGLNFTLATEKDIDRFYTIYQKTAEDGGFTHETIEFIKALADTPFSKLFVVHDNDALVAGGLILVDTHRKIATLDLTGATEEGLKLQAMPFLYWELIRYAQKNGMQYFDLGGYDGEAKEGDKTHNINKFKERFGGTITELEVFSTNAWYPTVRGLMRKARVIKKLYKKS